MNELCQTCNRNVALCHCPRATQSGCEGKDYIAIKTPRQTAHKAHTVIVLGDVVDMFSISKMGELRDSGDIKRLVCVSDGHGKAEQLQELEQVRIHPKHMNYLDQAEIQAEIDKIKEGV